MLAAVQTNRLHLFPIMPNNEVQQGKMSFVFFCRIELNEECQVIRWALIKAGNTDKVFIKLNLAFNSLKDVSVVLVWAMNNQNNGAAITHTVQLPKDIEPLLRHQNYISSSTGSF